MFEICPKFYKLAGVEGITCRYSVALIVKTWRYTAYTFGGKRGDPTSCYFHGDVRKTLFDPSFVELCDLIAIHQQKQNTRQ